MFKDLSIVTENRPGSIAKVAEALGIAGVNIDGICGIGLEGKAYIHILVQEVVKARRALEANHIEVSEELDVLVLEVEDRPGVVGNISRRLANAGVDIQLAYLATSTRLVINVDDFAKAREALLPKRPL
jgi:hypothetical protein